MGGGTSILRRVNPTDLLNDGDEEHAIKRVSRSGSMDIEGFEEEVSAVALCTIPRIERSRWTTGGTAAIGADSKGNQPNPPSNLVD